MDRLPHRHAFEEHTGEVRIALEAPSLEGLLSQAARALAELMVERPDELGQGDSLEITVDGRDEEALLVNWIDELIFLTDTSGVVYPSVEWLTIEGSGGEALHAVARIRGGPPQSFKTSVKAATFHGLQVRVGDQGASAAVILDV